MKKWIRWGVSPADFYTRFHRFFSCRFLFRTEQGMIESFFVHFRVSKIVYVCMKARIQIKNNLNFQTNALIFSSN